MRNNSNDKLHDFEEILQRHDCRFDPTLENLIEGQGLVDGLFQLICARVTPDGEERIYNVPQSRLPVFSLQVRQVALAILSQVLEDKLRYLGQILSETGMNGLEEEVRNLEEVLLHSYEEVKRKRTTANNSHSHRKVQEVATS